MRGNLVHVVEVPWSLPEEFEAYLTNNGLRRFDVPVLELLDAKNHDSRKLTACNRPFAA